MSMPSQHYARIMADWIIDCIITYAAVITHMAMRCRSPSPSACRAASSALSLHIVTVSHARTAAHEQRAQCSYRVLITVHAPIY